MDSRLTWKHHISELAKKLNRAVGLLYKIRQFCPKDVLRSLYFSLFSSHMGYAISVWGKCDHMYLQKITLLQKRIVRAMSVSDFHAPSKPLLKDLGILTVEDLYYFQTASLMWDFDHNQLPTCLNSLFIRCRNVHNIPTRNVNENRLYCANKRYTKHGTDCFSLQGALTLNKIKDLHFYSDCKKSFLSNLKASFLSNYWSKYKPLYPSLFSSLFFHISIYIYIYIFFPTNLCPYAYMCIYDYVIHTL